jgi:hypothetical protein
MMRDATKEELESVDNYIKSISKPTGVDFWEDNKSGMKIERVIEIMQNEQKCVEIASNGACDRDCALCDLVLPSEEILEAYSYVINELKYSAKHQPMIDKKL